MAVKTDDLSQVAKDFPTTPGVYLMKDAEGKIIYIGKAKSLRARVRTYFAGGDGRAQIRFLMKRVTSIDKIVTENEQQAFILERDLISKHKPRYNIRLKDDKAYLSIRIDQNAAWPRLELVRRVEPDGALYFGPYTFSYELRSLLETVNRVVPLRTCSDTVFHNRQRPCMEYQIKRCAGPCCLPVDQAQYRSWIKQAISILEGETGRIETELQTQMERASEELRFEDAALYRDRVELLKRFRQGAHLVSTRGENRDVFALHRDERLAALSVLQVRNGRVADTVNFALENVEISDEEVLEGALSQFYDSGRPIPDEIILPLKPPNLSIVQQALEEKRGERLEISVPQRGVKFRLLGLAGVNASEHYRSSFEAEDRYLEIAKSLARNLKLKQVPRRIEAVDISNFQGTDIVGAIVCFADGVADKSAYRRYKLSNQGKPDDFASIYEVVGRRLKSGLEKNDLPDLLVVDGGENQLAMALKAREETGAQIEMIGLAKMRTDADALGLKIEKRPERVFLEGAKESIPLDPASSMTQFLQRVRDEVHRFVITFHRKRRSKRIFTSVLDDVSGLGPERKRRLIARYGSVENMKTVSLEDLAKTGRMPLSLAARLKSKL